MHDLIGLHSWLQQYNYKHDTTPDPSCLVKGLACQTRCKVQQKILNRAAAMTSFSLHFRMANSNTITHFVEPILLFFTNWCRRAGTVTRVGHTFVLLGLVQPILPCRSKLLYWFLWVTSPPWRAASSNIYNMALEWALSNFSLVRLIMGLKIWGW